MTYTAPCLRKANTTPPRGAAERERWAIPMDEDLVLMRRVAAGDRQAFEMLYRRYAQPLAGYLTKLLHQRELVEEVLDDVMLVVWQNAARFDPTARFSTWLFGIAHHKAMKAWGRSANKPLPLPPLRHDAESDQETPEQILTDQERSRTLVQALESLSPEQRAVVELTFYHACSYQDIAGIMGCPVNTVKTRMFHARRRLAQYLEALGLRHSSGRQEKST
jgi:RNA polymerase sigma factor (sigma-70 family)